MTPNPNPSPELLKDYAVRGLQIAAQDIKIERMSTALKQIANPPWASGRETPADACGEMQALANAALSPQTLPAPGEVGARFWLIAHKPGNVPERKGSWPITEQTRVLREFMKARPDSYLHIVTIDHYGAPDVQHGPEALQMADGRSMGVGRKHNARTLAAHTEAFATVAAANDEGVALEPMHPDGDGWSDWVHPLPGYRMGCCDCGLVHDMQFKIVPHTQGGALNPGETSAGVVIFRAKRSAR